MITHLHIRDYILIDHLEWDIREGFTSITGETGAGKSILIGAIQLLLGGRAEGKKMILEGAPKAIVEATFALEEGDDLRPLFEQNDLDYSPVCLLRREVLRSGKSRAFINDTPVSAALLKEAGDLLVDIHSQHHNRLIGDPLFQLSVVDTLAANRPLREEYDARYRHYRELLRQLREEEERVRKERQEEDYISFQYKQLDEAHITPGEEAELQERLTLAEHATEISRLMQELSALNGDDDQALLPALRRLAHDCQAFADALPAAADYAQRLEAACIDLADISSDAARRLDDIDLDPQELDRLQARMDLLRSLIYKHNVANGDELIALRDHYREQLASIASADNRLDDLRKALSLSLAEARAVAARLTESRRQASKAFVPRLMELIAQLGIAGASFEVSIEPASDLADTGADVIRFLIATNKQTLLRPIDEIASGGEISRIMLALKAIIAEHRTLPTVIFDEIDTGVSGAAAERLGQIMKRLSRHIQVLSITHLPQIAALADHQVVVRKEEGDALYHTSLLPVEGEERVAAIASMLSGSAKTQAALDNARALLRGAAQVSNS